MWLLYSQCRQNVKKDRALGQVVYTNGRVLSYIKIV